MWPFTRGRRRPPRTAGPVIPDRLRSPRPQAGPAAPLDRALKAAQHTLAAVTATDQRLVENLINEAQDAVWRLDGILASLAGGSTGTVPARVEDIYHRLKAEIGMSPDIIIRRFTVGRRQPLPALLVFVEGLTSNQMVDQDTVAVLQAYADAEALARSPGEALALVHDRVVAVGHATTGREWESLLTGLMGGNALLFLEGARAALVLDTSKYPQRAISSPTDERSVRGPQESFNEVSWTSMALLRRRIRTPRLRFDAMKLGTRTHTTVSVAHIEGLTNPVLVEAVRNRLAQVNVDGIQMASELMPFLVTRQRTLFPLARATQRVDLAVHALLEGRVVVLIENTPTVLILPTTFVDFYRTSQDYSMSFWEGSLTRLIRLLGLLTGLFLPPLYVALVGVDPELLPTKLAITIAGSRVNIPFSPIYEVITMWVIIEILREATIRLPKEMSTTLGTVGAIVVGTAIVKAGVVSPLMIIIITMTALALYTAPAYEMGTPWRILFWALVLAANFLGVFGIVLVGAAIVTYLAALEDFGVPYLSPSGPWRWRDLLDSWIRAPYRVMSRTRPVAWQPVNIRQGTYPDRPAVADVDLGAAQEQRHDG